MSTNLETKRQLRACRRLAVSYPDRTAAERLARIADIASGKAEPTMGQSAPSPDLAERIAAGQASRAKGNAHDRIEREAVSEAEKKRKKRNTRDRQQKTGRDRGTK